MNIRRAIVMGIFATCTMLQVLLVVLPGATIVQIRNGFSWVGDPINWLEANMPWFSMIHFVVFVLIGLVAYFSFPSIRFSRLFGGLFIFAVLTESVQFLVPGRSPGAVDFIADFLGILIGLGIGYIGSRLLSGSPSHPESLNN